MVKTFATNPRIGGPDLLVSFIDWMHEQGKLVIKDEVLQHTANHVMKQLHWGLKTPYWTDDITGCGNTVNTSPGSVMAELSLQMTERDLTAMGFDGIREDLFGAVHRETAAKIRDLTLGLGKRIYGEPYGVPYDRSHWTNKEHVVRNAGLWDHDYYNTIRYLVRDAGSAPPGNTSRMDTLVSSMRKHSWWGQVKSWLDTPRDGISIIETHDGETLAHFMGGIIGRYRLPTPYSWLHRVTSS